MWQPVPFQRAALVPYSGSVYSDVRKPEEPSLDLTTRSTDNPFTKLLKNDRRGTMELRGIAIVNGAQTTGALSRSGSTSLAEVSVLARFIKSDNDEIIDEIIRYNNSQNPIKPADFRSTDRHQERLRRQFKAIPDALYFGARRGGQEDRARRPSNLISSDTVAQALAAFHGQPGVAYHQLRSIWENDQTYSDYFSEVTTAPHIVFAYSLLTAIQRQKLELVQREARLQLAEDERETRNAKL